MAVVVEELPALCGTQVRQGVAQVAGAVAGTQGGVAAAHLGLHPAGVQRHHLGTRVVVLRRAHDHVEGGLADAVERRIARLGGVQAAHLAADEGQHTASGFYRGANLRHAHHGPHHVGVHHTVKRVLGGRCVGTGAVHHAGHIDGHIQGQAVELPGQRRHTGRVGHVHAPAGGACCQHPVTARVIARGAHHAPAVGHVLLGQIQTNAA